MGWMTIFFWSWMVGWVGVGRVSFLVVDLLRFFVLG